MMTLWLLSGPSPIDVNGVTDREKILMALIVVLVIFVGIILVAGDVEDDG